ncbi:MAG TPA: class I adenylate-forming enzyme family protein, partial [Candidatus Methylomirabilis sp.]|nr:class I adenylate-forming enzyme family protein [Candidatus Methylomirabilis sp.]
PRLMYRALFQSASRAPDHAAMVIEGRGISFRDLTEMSGRAAAAFQDAGMRKGDRVLVLLRNGPEYAAVFFGLLAAGGVAVPLNPTNTADSVRYVAGHCRARFAVVNEQSNAYLAEWWRGSPAFLDGPARPGTVSLTKILSSGTHLLMDVDPQRNGEKEPVLLLYTSGTTGPPKGVMLSRENLVANTDSILEYLRLERSDRTLAILPFYYSYGNSILLTHVFAGATLVIENGFAYTNKALSVMRDQRVTGFSGVPSHYAMLIGRSRFLESDWPHLRYMTCAGGPLPVAHIQRIRKALPKIRLHVMYGQTEGAARLSSLDPELVESKIGSIGRGIPGVELRVVGNDGRDVEPGDVGEIVARGKNLMIGYLGDPGGTAEVLRDGWLHTGDLATVDDEGFIFIRGREKEFIKSGGYRIGPQQIEDVLLQHPSVQECGVVGVPDELLGEQVFAFAVFRPEAGPGVAEKDLLDFLRERLPAYMVPARIVPVGLLPKTETGKVKRQQLREILPPA